MVSTDWHFAAKKRPGSAMTWKSRKGCPCHVFLFLIVAVQGLSCSHLPLVIQTNLASNKSSNTRRSSGNSDHRRSSPHHVLPSALGTHRFSAVSDDRC